MTRFDLIDPDAPIAENVGAVLAYVDERDEWNAAEREQEAARCRRARRRIAAGRPPLSVLHAVEKGTAPGWVVDDLRRAVAA